MGLLVISITFFVLASGAHGQNKSQISLGAFDAAANITSNATASKTRTFVHPVNLPSPTVDHTLPLQPKERDGIPLGDYFTGTEYATLECVRPEKALLLNSYIGSKFAVAVAGWITNTYVTIPGQWQFQDCSFGSVKSFRTSTKQYKDALKKCQDMNYKTAQPSEGSKLTPFVNEGFPFQVGGYYMPYYPGYADQTPDPKHFPSARVITCDKNAITPLPNDNYPYKNQRVQVYCAKPAPGILTNSEFKVLTVPHTGILTNDFYYVEGKWDAYGCQFGAVKYFQVSTETYNDVINKCKKLGYVTAQPVDPECPVNCWRPFMVSGVLTKYYYKAIYAQNMELYPQAAVPFFQCMPALD